MIPEVYRKLSETMAKRGGVYPGMDIPEFYALVEEIFTAEEAEVSNAMPRGVFTADDLADLMGRPVEELTGILAAMTKKGLCYSVEMEGTRFYGGPPFVPGIMEYLFMRGTATERDRKVARLVHGYKEAVDRVRGDVPPENYPGVRVIPIDATIKDASAVRTYHQVLSYIDRSDPIAVSTCYCRHEAKLIDEKDHCGKPDGVCMQFGIGARFTIESGLAREVSRDEARRILRDAEDAGLVHCTHNVQDISFICNCCNDHCIIITPALRQAKPSLVLNSGFRPVFDEGLCTACGICLDRCPAKALAAEEGEAPRCDLDRCFGCGLCASGCPSEAAAMVGKEGVQEPPLDAKALKEAIKAARAVPTVTS
jgi:Pyruvate/2-oxoacid:ferredoxin oxidoreductase delta subunit